MQHDIRKEISTRTLKRAEMLWQTGLFRTPLILLDHFMKNWSPQERDLIESELSEEVKEMGAKELLSEEETSEMEEAESGCTESTKAGKNFLESLATSEVSELSDED